MPPQQAGLVSRGRVEGPESPLIRFSSDLKCHCNEFFPVQCSRLSLAILFASTKRTHQHALIFSGGAPALLLLAARLGVQPARPEHRPRRSHRPNEHERMRERDFEHQTERVSEDRERCQSLSSISRFPVPRQKIFICCLLVATHLFLFHFEPPEFGLHRRIA